MTIIISAARASTLATAGTSNNPFALWDNLGASGTWSTNVGAEVNSAAYAGTGTTYDQWSATPNVSGFSGLAVDLGSVESVGMIAIAAHNAGTLGAELTVYHSPTGLAGSWVSAADAVTPADNQAICWYFADTSARYWRVLFEQSPGATAEAVCGVVFIGQPLTMPQSIYQGYRPPLTPTEVALQSNVSEGGHLLGSSAVKKASTTQAEIRHIAASTIRGTAWKGFQTHFNEGGGFFWAWRPTKYGDVHYAWRNGAPIAPDNSGPKDYMSARLEMRLYDEP